MNWTDTFQTDAERVSSLRKAVEIFDTGCSNTLGGAPPETCPECLAIFLSRVRHILKESR